MKRCISLFAYLIGTAAAQTPGALSVSGDPANVAALYRALGTNQKDPCIGNHSGDSPQIAQTRLSYCLAVKNMLHPSANQLEFAALIAAPSSTAVNSIFGPFLASVAANRIDVQNGADAKNPGSNSAVVRAGVSDVLGVALDAGAITQTVNGSTLTLQANGLSLYRFATGQQVFKFCAMEVSCESTFEKALNNLSGGTMLDLTKKTTETVSGTVAETGAPIAANYAILRDNSAHLTGFTVRYQILNGLNVRSDLYKKAWKAAITDTSVISAAKLLDTSSEALGWLSAHSEVDAWYKAAVSTLENRLQDPKTPLPDRKFVEEQWQKLITEANQNEWIDLQKIRTFLNARNAFLAVSQAALANARQQAASGLNLEYVYARQSNQPRTSTARLAYTIRPGAAPADPRSVPNDTAISINVAAEFYNTPPPGTGTFRDFQAGLQLDRHFGTTIGTIAGYFQYQNQPAALQIGTGDLAPNTNIVLPGQAATLLAPKGNIGVVQAKVTFSLGNGAKLPVGVTWSNRTELIKGNEVRGHIGFNFDWSSLFAAKQ